MPFRVTNGSHSTADVRMHECMGAWQRGGRTAASGAGWGRTHDRESRGSIRLDRCPNLASRWRGTATPHSVGLSHPARRAQLGAMGGSAGSGAVGSLQPCAARLVHSAESPVSMLYVDSRESCCSMRESPERAASKGARSVARVRVRVTVRCACVLRVGCCAWSRSGSVNEPPTKSPYERTKSPSF